MCLQHCNFFLSMGHLQYCKEFVSYNVVRRLQRPRPCNLRVVLSIRPLVLLGAMAPDATETTEPTGPKCESEKKLVELKLKHGWPFPDMTDPPLSFRIKSSFIIPMVGTFSKILLKWCNKVNGHNIQQLRNMVANRPAGTPLLTVSNHYSCLDDPALWGLLRWRDLWNARRMRWSPAAHDIAFTRKIYSWFFSAGKCVPIIRGLGVYQEAMDFLIERLKEGQWVHIFPEGKVNMSLERMRLKWGVGRLVYESPVCPIVLPFYHIGMDEILPNRKPYIPRVGKLVTVVVGEPMDFKDLVSEMKAKQEDPTTARKVITDRIQEELGKLRDQAEELHEKMKRERNL